MFTSRPSLGSANDFRDLAKTIQAYESDCARLRAARSILRIHESALPTSGDRKNARRERLRLPVNSSRLESHHGIVKEILALELLRRE
jgi:hypothetical protein